jgi:hypothetical protein
MAFGTGALQMLQYYIFHRVSPSRFARFEVADNPSSFLMIYVHHPVCQWLLQEAIRFLFSAGIKGAINISVCSEHVL